MSDSKAKVFTEIELGEFERRLLAAHTMPRGAEDPLSELTRLVSTIAADRAAGAKIVDLAPRGPKPERSAALSHPVPAPRPNPEATIAATAESAPAPKPAPRFASNPEPAVTSRLEPQFEAKREPSFVRPPEPAPEPEFKVEPAPVTPVLAGKPEPKTLPKLERLRARFAGFGTNVEPQPVARREEPSPLPLTPALRTAIPEGALDDDEETNEFFAPPPPLNASARAGDRSRRARSWYLKVGGLTALGVLMAAGAVATKLGVSGPSKPPPLILAAESPSKVAPPSEAAVQSPGDSGSLLLKDSANPAPPKIVNNEEVPVDLSALSRESQTAAAAPAPAPSPQPSAAATANVAEATPVAPTADTPVVAPSESLGGAPASAPPSFPTAKRVKTVSVRPDGTVISVASVPAAAPSQITATEANGPAPARAATTPMAATPTLDLPEKPAAKSAARVTATKTATTVPPDDEFNTPNVEAAPPPAKSTKLPTKLRPPKATADAAAPVVASNATPAAEGGGGGNWAVQFAAPRSEADAQTQVSWLKSKYADNLGGAALGVHKVEVNGETVYRVRAGGLTKADAAALCGKLKASGGDCFVARN